MKNNLRVVIFCKVIFVVKVFRTHICDYLKGIIQCSADLFLFGTFQLPFGEDDDELLSPPQCSQDSAMPCNDLAQSFVNLELGRVKIETTQEVMLHIYIFVKLLFVKTYFGQCIYQTFFGSSCLGIPVLKKNFCRQKMFDSQTTAASWLSEEMNVLFF